jgi:hypothetical protein
MLNMLLEILILVVHFEKCVAKSISNEALSQLPTLFLIVVSSRPYSIFIVYTIKY